MPEKKPWTAPMLRSLPVTDELLARIARANGTTADGLRDLMDRRGDGPPPMQARRAR